VWFVTRRTAAVDAVVVGAGPNGLVAANLLADEGWSVTLLEAQDRPGGSVQSAELVEPGFVNDRFSAFYPLGAASPVFDALELEPWGLRWLHAPLVLAHPALDGSCVVVSRDPDETAASLDSFAPGDGDAWLRLMRLWQSAEPAILRGMMTPFPQLLAAAQLATRPGPGDLWRLGRAQFDGEGAERLLAGNALHTDLPPTSRLGRLFGVLLSAFAQRYGYPCVEGGAGKLTQALVARAEASGVSIRCGTPVVSIEPGTVRLEGGEAVRAGRAVLAAIDTWELGRLLGRASKTRPDPAVVKVDWTLEGPVPWAAEQARRASVVHVGGPSRLFAIFGQYSPADPSRAPAGKETAWAYTHVSPGANEAVVAARIEAELEALAPGFGELVRGRHVASLPPGRVNGGTARLGNQLVFRGRLGRPATGVPGVYLASSSAHPGGGVHGAPGWIAAKAAIRTVQRRHVTRSVARAPARSPRRDGHGDSSA